MPSFQRHVFVCVNERPADDPRGSCKAKGGVEVRDRLKKELKARGIAKIVRANNAGCLDQCARGVSVVVYPDRVWYGGVTVDDVTEIVESHLVGGKVVERLLMPDQPHVDAKVHLPILKTGVVLLALAMAHTAYADDKIDPNAESAAHEANLESNAPRQGVTIGASIGPGLMIQKGTVGTSGSIALRLGHVATPTTVVEVMIVGSAFPHTIGTSPPSTFYDQSTTLMLAAQRYINPSLFLRLGGGLNFHTIDNGPMGKTTHWGPAGSAGAGIDLVRRHLWVLGIEGYGILGIESGGALFAGAFALGLSHY